MGLIQIGKKHERDGDLGVITLSLEKVVNWARKGSLWCRSVSRLASSVGCDDCRRHGVPSDGSSYSENIRSNAGTQICDLDGIMCDLWEYLR